MTITTRKSHVKRCFGVIKNASGGYDDNFDMYVDIIRTDEFTYLSSHGGQYFTCTIDWQDDKHTEMETDEEIQDGGTISRKTEMGKAHDPELGEAPDPNTDFVPFRVIDKMVIFEQGQKIGYEFANKNVTLGDNPQPIPTKRQIWTVRLNHRETIVDDKLNEKGGTHCIKLGEYAFKDTPEDKTQYIDSEVIKQWTHTLREGNQRHKVEFQNKDVYEDLTLKLDDIKSPGTNSSGGRIIAARLDPFQNVINVQWGGLAAEFFSTPEKSYIQLTNGFTGADKMTFAIWFRVDQESIDACKADWAALQDSGNTHTPLAGIIPIFLMGREDTKQKNVKQEDPRPKIGTLTTNIQSFEIKAVGPGTFLTIPYPGLTPISMDNFTNPNCQWKTFPGDQPGFPDPSIHTPPNPSTEDVLGTKAIYGPDNDGVSEYPVSPSYIGLSCKGTGNPVLEVNIQMLNKGKFSGSSHWDNVGFSAPEYLKWPTPGFNIDEIDLGIHTDDIPPGAAEDPPGSGFYVLARIIICANYPTLIPSPYFANTEEVPPNRTWIGTTAVKSNADLTIGAKPDSFSNLGNGRGEHSIIPDHWHCAIVGLDFSGKISVKGIMQDDPPTEEETGSVSSAVKMYLALNDVNYTKGNLSGYWPKSGGNNDVLSVEAWAMYTDKIDTNLGDGFDDTFGNIRKGAITGWEVATYVYSPGELDTSKIGLPVYTKFAKDHMYHCELGELQIFNNVEDSASLDLRRAFIDEDGYPVKDRSKAEKILGPAVVRIHGSGSWIKGRNTGTSGLKPDGTPIPAGQFDPVGKIEKYTPDPSLFGPQVPKP